VGKYMGIVKMKGIDKVGIGVLRYGRKFIDGIVIGAAYNYGVRRVDFPYCIDCHSLDFPPAAVGDAVGLVEDLIDHVLAPVFITLRNLRPYFKENPVDVFIGGGHRIKGMVVNNNIQLVLFRPTDRGVKEFQQQRIKNVCGRPAGHAVHSYRKPDHIRPHAFYVDKILFIKPGKVNRLRAGSFKPN